MPDTDFDIEDIFDNSTALDSDPSPDEEDFDPTSEDAEADDSDDDEETEDDDSEDESDEDDSDEDDAEEDEWPKVISGHTYANQDAVNKALAEAHLHISRTSKEERTPLAPAANPLGGSGDWETDYAALEPKMQAQIKGMWDNDLEGLAMRVANDPEVQGYLGADLSLHIYQTWAEANPYKALSWEFSQGLHGGGAATAPAMDPYVEKVAQQGRVEAANTLISENVPGWNAETDAEVKAFIEANQLDLSDMDRSDPEQVAATITQIYYIMEGQKAAATRAGLAPASGKKRARTNKSKATTPVKGGVAAPAAPDTASDFFDQVFADEDKIF